MAEPMSGRGFNLAAAVAEIPEDALGIIRNGFAIAATLSDERRQQVIQLLISQFRRAGGSLDNEQVARATNLSRREASRLSSALSVMIGLITETSASADDFVAIARGRFFEDREAPIVESIARVIVSQRPALQETIARESLAAAVLPSLASFNIAIDLRCEFIEDRISNRVAVAVVHIGTDDRSHQLWVQLTRADIERIVARLTEALKRMEMVEAIDPERKIGETS